MRRYETIFITNPDLQEGARKKLFEKFTNLLAQEGGLLVKFEEWGNRKLAYEINKKTRGHYICMTYGGTGDIIKELERNFRLDDNIMKFMTILLEKDVDIALFEAEIAAGTENKTASQSMDDTSDSDNNSNDNDNNDNDSNDNDSNDNNSNDNSSNDNNDNAEAVTEKEKDSDDLEEEK